MENKNKIIIFKKDFKASPEKFQYFMIRDFYEGEKVKILLKYKEKPNDIVKISVFLKERRIMEFKTKTFPKILKQYLEQILGLEMELKMN